MDGVESILSATEIRTIGVCFRFHDAYPSLDAHFQEHASLTNMSITKDGFTFMLVFGDLCRVSLTYSFQARHWAEHDPLLSALAMAGIFLLYAMGFTIF